MSNYGNLILVKPINSVESSISDNSPIKSSMNNSPKEILKGKILSNN